MRRHVCLVPLLVAASLLVSCATTKGRQVPRAELYDSVAAPAPAGETTEPSLIEPSIPAPPATAAGSASDDETSGHPPPKAGLIVPPSPSQPAASAGLPESPGLIPVSPRKAAKFPLAAPVVPPPAAGKPSPSRTAQAAVQPAKPSASGGAAASRPAAGSPAAARGDAASPSASGAAPTARAAAPAGGAEGAAPATSTTESAGSAGGPAPGSSAGGATPAASASTPAGSGSATTGGAASPGAASQASGTGSYGRLREIYARQGDELQVGLDGSGFLFLGFPDRSALADGMSFKGKEIRNGKTWFTFRALKLGNYDLDFLQQDNATGKSDKETVRVHVVTEQDFTAAVNPQGSTDVTAPDTGDTEFAGRLASVGAYASAVAELQKGYREGNPGLNDQIASLYMRMGSYDSAGKYYSKNITPPNDYSQRAVVGLVSIAVAQKDQKALMGSLKQFLAIRDPSVEEPLIQAIRMEANRGEIGLGLDLAGEYVARYPNGRWRDEVGFLTANLLEGDSQFRDIARARDLYRGILADNPESAFAAAAREHLSYIERHFYQVR